MTIVEAIRTFGNVEDFIVNDLPQLAAEIASRDTVAQITNRVIETGLNKDGVKFSSYSTNEVSASAYLGKGKNKSVDAKLKELSKNKIRVSYKGFRELNNLPTSFKNFSFTTEMFKKFDVKTEKTITRSDGFDIFLGGTTDASQKKIDDNSQREGIDIIENNQDESDHFEDALNFVIEQKIQELLG